MRLVLLFCAFIALVFCGCGDKACQRPAQYTNFTRLNLEDVRREIRYYFPSSPTPPPGLFISDGSAIPSLQFKTDASLSVTFMFEGAGNRNQLGYYTFDKNAQGVISNVQETILFPDIEADNKPCVWTGMTVTSPVIPAGKRFGFFLISDGYCGASQKFYTDSSLNTPNDRDVRHVGLYVDFFRELLIIGFEDLLRQGWDNDFEDTMFIFDSNGVEVQFDGVPYACTKTPCYNGGVCDYTTGQCNCANTKYTGRSCTDCSCTDNNPCTPDTCNGGQCIGQTYMSDISQCLRGQSCSNGPCVTTGIPTTGIPTTGIPTTGRATTGVAASTAASSTAQTPGTSVVTTGVATTGIPTTGRLPFTTGAITTGRGTTGLITTGQINGFTNTRVRPNNTETFQEGSNIPTISSDEVEGGAIVVGLSLICSFAVFLF